MPRKHKFLLEMPGCRASVAVAVSLIDLHSAQALPLPCISDAYFSVVKKD